MPSLSTLARAGGEHALEYYLWRIAPVLDMCVNLLFIVQSVCSNQRWQSLSVHAVQIHTLCDEVAHCGSMRALGWID